MSTNSVLHDKHKNDDFDSRLFRINHSSSLFLLRIIDDITDLSKIELKQFKVEKSWFCLKDVLEEVYDQMSLPIEMKKLAFFLDIGAELKRGGCKIYSDPKRIKQVLFNLVGNAKKFTFTGGIKVEVKVQDQDERPRMEEIQVQI